jgi:hypothetical protein
VTRWFDEKSTVTLMAPTSLLSRVVCARPHAYTSTNQKFPSRKKPPSVKGPPTTTIRDDATYDILRPGIMIS